MAFDLLDSSGQAWRFSITDAGNLTSTQVAGRPASTTPLADSSDISVFNLGVTTGGLITATLAGLRTNQPDKILLISSGGVKWYLISTRNGVLQALYGPNPVPPSVGDLFPIDASYPPAQQPGGSGTPVTMPVQTANEQTSGKLRAGCGHSFNSWEIRSVTSGPGQAAVISCPLCGYCQRILFPYSLVQDNTINPVIQA